MADKTKRPRLDIEDTNLDFLSDEKVAQYLAKYSSTVFACETSADTGYIKCDFPCCSEHPANQEGKNVWMLNTISNVKTLEKHVGKEVAQFMNEHLSQSFDQNSHLEATREVLTSQSLRKQTRKVLAVFNLADPQSLLGKWIALFLKAAEMKYGRDICDVEIITQSFKSRYELMACITKLEFIKKYPCVDVIAMLSCHSSSQGQVFSCTPSMMSRCFKYEEFCSLHDFVQVLQDALGQSLSAVHISSCFTLKLDCSHQDWPVDVGWLKRKLHCTLSGSTKEVYETGSQVADLYLSLSTLADPIEREGCLGNALRDAIYSARLEAFPDLAREMGLEVLSPRDVGKKSSSPCIDEEVSAPSQVNSCLHVVLLIGYDVNDDLSQASHQALADALVANLTMRQMSDVKCKHTKLPCYEGETSWKDCLHSCIHSVANSEEKLFFVALGSCWTHLGLLDTLKQEFYSLRNPDYCYGVHFQEITSMQAYFLKSRLNRINCSENVMRKSYEEFPIVVTGLVQDKKSSPVNTFPVLLYMIHLAVGENGKRISGEGHIPAHVKYKQYKGPGISHWRLEDVYMETCYVLSGLSRKAGLCLLSLPQAITSHTEGKLRSEKSLEASHNQAYRKEYVDGQFSNTTSHVRERINYETMSDLTIPKSNSCFDKEACYGVSSLERENRPDSSSSLDSHKDNVTTTETIALANCRESVISRSREVLHSQEMSTFPLANSTVDQSVSSLSESSMKGTFPHEIETLPEMWKHRVFINPAGDVLNSPTGGKSIKRALSHEHFSKDSDPSTKVSLPSPSENIQIVENRASVINSLSSTVSDFSRPKVGKSSMDLSKVVNSNNMEKCTVYPCPGYMGLATLRHDSNGDSCRPSSLHSPISACSISKVDGSGMQMLSGHKPDKAEHLSKVENRAICSDSSAITGSSDSRTELALNDNISDMDECRLSCLNCSQWNCNSLKVRNYNVDVTSSLETEYLFNAKCGNPAKNSSFNELSRAKLRESRIGIASQCKLGEISAGKYIVSSTNSTVSSFGVSNLGGTLSDKSERIPSAEKCAISSQNYFMNNCDCSKVDECRINRVSPNKTSHIPVEKALFNESARLDQIECESCIKKASLDKSEKICLNKCSVPSQNDCRDSMHNETNIEKTLPSKPGNINLNQCSVLSETGDSNGSKVDLCVTQLPSEQTHACDVEDEYVCITDDETDRPCSSSQWQTSDEVPLMANVDEVLVTHYVLNLSINFSKKVMSGDITLFLKPASQHVTQRQFQLCLDCSLVDIETVEEIDLRDDFNVRQYATANDGCPTKCSPYPPDIFQVDKYKKVPVALPYTLLPYAVRNWCVRIWKPDEVGRSWPRCVRIKYCTRPEGKSLTWTTDQDNRPCVFSPGAYINNRSLMPCQEPPIAMSTWQAAIHVPKGYTVLMSGNELAVQNSDESDIATFLYEMNIPLPCSTLALAIGAFECRQTSTVALSCTIPCRVFSATSLINVACEELLPRCAKYVTAACGLLGPYPFTRMDLVILPRCFACMGLMSPNMAFLSQSILARDGSMCTRVAHEISHSWFGLLIGAKDWSEEWLSEGFATYMEERILCKVEGWKGDEELFNVELCQILRHRTLLAEFQHADENMQRLRPKLPSVLTAAEAVRRSMKMEDGENNEVRHTTVTNGQVCSKKWTQIYYLKGYFLLHYMASLVGVTNFEGFLKEYVFEYGGKLVNSEDFFDFFENKFTSFREKNVKDQLMKEWLERHGLPKHVPKKIGRPDNHLIKKVELEFGFWKKTDANNKRKKTQHIRTKKPIKDHPTVNDQIQLVVLLERLLERDTIATATLTQLDNCYHFAQKNAEVRHRWCELVVKHRYSPGYPEVKRFLIEDQGMGIYLFGELLISQQPKQKQLVLDVLAIIGAEMDQCTLKTVQDMLEGRD